MSALSGGDPPGKPGLYVVPGTPLSELDDAALVARCLRRDSAAERELFRREYQRVNATLYRIAGSDRESEDMVQDTFIEVFRSLGNFRGESKLSTWIDRIAVRVAYHHLGRRKLATVHLDLVPEMEDPGATPDQRAHSREGIRHLYEALNELPVAMRICITLTLIDGRPPEEVAQLMSASVMTTRVRLWRARRALEKRAASDPVLAAYLATKGQA